MGFLRRAENMSGEEGFCACALDFWGLPPIEPIFGDQTTIVRRGSIGGKSLMKQYRPEGV